MTFLLYEGDRRGSEIVKAERMPWNEAEALLGKATFEHIHEELELIEHVGDKFDHARFLSGEVSPLFWGSAMNNFGVEELLRYLADHAAGPGPRKTEDGEMIDPESERFTGFVFKIQANMNPRHRDGIAFLRVVSGKFQRGMDAVIGHSGEVLRLSKPHSFLAQERSLVEEAWPGDIVGIYNTGKLRVGDTLAADGVLRFAGIPRFAPEHFGQLRLADPLKRKALDSGLEQLAQEGVIQLFFTPGHGRQNPYLGAVGMLQFEVLKERLRNEYNVNAHFEKVRFTRARWVGGKPEALEWLRSTHGYGVLEDRNGQPVVLTDSEWNLNYALEKAPGLELCDVEPL